ncbi:hypothetical protein MVLG_07213 [Microbotryum lychnidis-dioicae p1A1 Lamole]|uniref:Uncharacterized protein n=1 Tax=Microbotryum lychnidis-dioicae (strain p1A1 Lamole / MvSl-1064) TaxID=683840 RepID=U5HJN3_USTV1|nr:hypothetical protein MVLG_07213 [Microbotryum lychnidis-dioicae p1A1 Lamole]|eukprot:KDE02216.1 hypothetical protein MVLG_07213 [Microbotryum lychnidis-dioicae p1A1 Lamole]
MWRGASRTTRGSFGSTSAASPPPSPKKPPQRFYHARYCPNGAFDYSIFLYRTVVSQFYDADTSPMTTRPKVSTMDSTFQAQCTTVITTCQPVADFQCLVLEMVQQKAD